MNWLEAIPALLSAIFLLIMPGALLVFTLGARGVWFYSTAAAASIAFIGISATVAPWLGMGWGIAAFLLVSAAITLIAFIAKLFWMKYFQIAKPSLADLKLNRDTGLGLLVAFLLLGIFFITGISSPEFISQTYDNSFHLNAVRWILDTGSASPLDMKLAAPASNTVIYPTAWHAFVSLIVMFSGATIPVAVNAATLSIVAVLWPLSVVGLAVRLWPKQRNIGLATGALAASATGFPFLFVDWGVLYPNLLGYALVPILVGLFAECMQQLPEPQFDLLGTWLLFIGTLVGALIAHPTSFYVLAIFVAPMLVQLIISRLKYTQSHFGKLLAILSLAAGIIAAVGLWYLGNNNVHWNPYTTPFQAIIDAVLFAAPWHFPAIILTLLISYMVIKKWKDFNYSWLFYGLIIATSLFFIAAAVPNVLKIRSIFLGVWYGDPYRLAAILPLIAIPIAAFGLASLINKLNTLKGFRANLGLSALSLLVAAGVLSTSINSVQNLQTSYELDADSAYLSINEIEVFKYIEAELPADAVFAGNPWSGTSFVYAFTGRKTIDPHPRGQYSEAVLLIQREFTSGGGNVCEAVKSEKVTYVLDFGDKFILPGLAAEYPMPGFAGLEESDMVKKIFSSGDAVLYMVIGCELN